jgi:cytochrome c-type biogenesis protein
MSLGEDFARAVTDGPLLLALPVAAAAGLVSFLSPCCLPLMPGYLSYVTGLAGDQPSGDVLERTGARLKVLVGSVLFVLGFSVVFVSGGALFGYFGQTLQEHQSTLSKVLGVLMILMGVFFMGLMPWFTQREFRFHKRPVAGLAGAPVLGALFAIGWTPCLGPTLSSVQVLAMNQASAGRGAILTVAYCLGLGIPFVLTAVAFRKALGAFGWVKRHYTWVMRIGGGMMIVTGLLLLTGAWDSIVQQMQTWSDGFTVGI